MKTPSIKPTNENAQLELGTFGTTEQQYGYDHSANHPQNQTFATLRAEFAQAGHTLRQTTNPDGTIYYLASRWGMFRELKGLEAAAAFLAVLGGM